MSYTLTIQTLNDTHSLELVHIIYNFIMSREPETNQSSIYISNDGSEHSCVPDINHGVYISFNMLTKPSLIMLMSISGYYTKTYNTTCYMDYDIVDTDVSYRNYDNIVIHWIKRLLGKVDVDSIKYFEMVTTKIRNFK